MRLKKIHRWLQILTLAVMTTLTMVSLIGCVSAGKELPVKQELVQEVDASSSASISEDWWELVISGLREETVTFKQFSELKKIAIRQGLLQNLEIKRQGVSSTYQAYPLKYLIARVDDLDLKAPFDFDDALWKEGYDITLTASDGYSATFSTTDIAVDALYVYDIKNGEPSNPGIIGLDVSSKYFINDIVSIQCSLAPAAVVEDMSFLEVVINDQQTNFSREELKNNPYYIEGKGGFTTSAGTYYENIYGGIRLADFLNSFVSIAPDNTVSLIATDGFSMSYNFSDLANSDDGIWILAFEIDGESMANDPGPFRGVKIRNEKENVVVPNIDGHSSPKMVKRIEVSADVFKDFSLLIRGKMDYTLDRSTIQSGVNCPAHNTSVNYANKKSGEVEHYTGMPLYLLLAFGDDPYYAPHKQTDKDILAYDQESAKAGYKVKITASDGYSIILDSRELDKNADVIVAMYQDGEELGVADWPLKLVWDTDATVVPKGIKAIKNIISIELLF